MLTVNTAHYISANAIFDEFGTHYNDYSIFDECANDSFIWLDLSVDKVQELQEEIEFYDNKFEDNYVHQMQKEIELINYLRALGFTDSILIEVSW